MTREEIMQLNTDYLNGCESEHKMNELFWYVLELQKHDQEPCETIKEIPKDYKYDAETKDFLVYRHMYTGHEIHIEKPVPRYRLDQEPCEDCISRQQAVDTIESWLSCDDYNDAERHIMRAMQSVLYDLQPVIPQPKTGYISIDDVMSVFDDFMCGEVDEDGTNTFLEMLKDMAESEE